MNSVKHSLDKLYSFCKTQDWIGYDPFDGLNSKIFNFSPILKNYKLCRLIFLQLNKRIPVNLRPILKISKGRNPKGIGLFLSSVTKLYKLNQYEEYLNLINLFIDWLKEDNLPGYSGNCWGYNFDWQSRAFFLPKGTPTVVNTCFIGRAFLYAYEILGNDEYLQTARSACDFILDDLNRVEINNTVGFSYSPLDYYFVNNATALASSLLSLVYERTGERRLAVMANKSIQYVVNNQQKAGAWNYGEDKTALNVGVDNFHIGFILESLKIYSEVMESDEYIGNIRKGLSFYQKNFFLENGAPKYFHNKIYPFDIHSASQAIVTLLQLKDYGADQVLCKKIISWMIRNMQDKKGYFYYQKKRLFTNKISYMRWSQAWAFHALTSYLVSNE